MGERRARFEPFEDVDGVARWRLVGGNGEKMAASEPYASKANAERGIRDAQVAVLETLEPELVATIDQLGADVLGMSPADVARFVIAAVAAGKA